MASHGQVVRGHQSGLIEERFDESLPQFRVLLPEMDAERFFPWRDQPVQQVCFGQSRFRKKEFGPADEGQEGGVVSGKIQEPEQSGQLAYHRVPIQLQRVFRDYRDVLLHQQVADQGGMLVGADQDADVPVAAPGGQVVHERVQPFQGQLFGVAIRWQSLHADVASGVHALGWQGLGALEKAAVHGCGKCRFEVVCGLGKEFICQVGDDIRIFEVAEKTVVEFHHVAEAAPVVRQGVGLGFFGQARYIRLDHDLVEQGGVSAAPAVDGLLDVAHEEKTAALGQAFSGQGGDGLPLIPVGVLKFVHQQVVQTAAEAAVSLRKPCRRHRAG